MFRDWTSHKSVAPPTSFGCSPIRTKNSPQLLKTCNTNDEESDSSITTQPPCIHIGTTNHRSCQLQNEIFTSILLHLNDIIGGFTTDGSNKNNDN